MQAFPSNTGCVTDGIDLGYNFITWVTCVDGEVSRRTCFVMLKGIVGKLFDNVRYSLHNP